MSLYADDVVLCVLEPETSELKDVIWSKKLKGSQMVSASILFQICSRTA